MFFLTLLNPRSSGDSLIKTVEMYIVCATKQVELI